MGPESPWGMVLHYPHENLIDILKKGAVAWLRMGVRFDSQPGPGQPPAWADAIRQVREANKGPRQEVYFGIDPNYPNWIASGAPLPDDDNDDDDGPGGGPRRVPRPRPPGNNEGSEDWKKRHVHWEDFVRQVIGFFGQRGVRYFNIGNEPNNPFFYRFGRDEYTTLLTIAARVIHGAGYKVCAPDIATDDKWNPWNFLKTCLREVREANQTLDVVSIHGYRGKNESALEFMNNLRPVMGALREYGVNAPVWLTETGVSNFHFPNDPAKNGRRVVEICQTIGEGMLPTFRPWGARQPKFIKKIFFFVWSDDIGEVGREREWGKYAWLSRAPGLEPLPHLWNAYKSVTGGS